MNFSYWLTRSYYRKRARVRKNRLNIQKAEGRAYRKASKQHRRILDIIQNENEKTIKKMTSKNNATIEDLNVQYHVDKKELGKRLKEAEDMWNYWRQNNIELEAIIEDLERALDSLATEFEVSVKILTRTVPTIDDKLTQIKRKFQKHKRKVVLPPELKKLAPVVVNSSTRKQTISMTTRVERIIGEIRNPSKDKST